MAIGSAAQQVIDAKKDILIDLAAKIWENPEVAWTERKASAWTAEVLEKEGFTVEKNYTGIPTAIRAVWGQGKPVIGLLGEYDALPNMSQKFKDSKEAIVEGAPGHACGHNMLGTAHVGAAIGLKQELEENDASGTIVFYGCPAEEVLTGKTFMARGGAFKELDIALAWHPAGTNWFSTGSMTACNSAIFHFKGITAHAGGDPHNGRSALDAAELMNVGVQFLREHVTDDVRVHYAFTNVHGAPNVVPDKASVWYYVRALTREVVVDVYNRLIKVAEGAAMMTETSVEVEFLGGCYDTLQNHVLLNTFLDTYKELPPVAWTKEDKKFAETLNTNNPNYDKLLAAGVARPGMHIDTNEPKIVAGNSFGSSDVGDVLHIVPGVIVMTPTANIGAPFHSWNITACGRHDLGMKGMLHAAKLLAVTAAKAAADPQIIADAKAEFAAKTRGREYVCPIPNDIPIPSGE